MSSSHRDDLSSSRSPGHLYEIGQRVRRKQSGSAHMMFGEPRKGTIVDLTWTRNKSGANYPTYAVRFDSSKVVDTSVQQMRLIPLD